MDTKLKNTDKEIKKDMVIKCVALSVMVAFVICIAIQYYTTSLAAVTIPKSERENYVCFDFAGIVVAICAFAVNILFAIVIAYNYSQKYSSEDNINIKTWFEVLYAGSIFLTVMNILIIPELKYKPENAIIFLVILFFFEIIVCTLIDVQICIIFRLYRKENCHEEYSILYREYRKYLNKEQGVERVRNFKVITFVNLAILIVSVFGIAIIGNIREAWILVLIMCMATASMIALISSFGRLTKETIESQVRAERMKIELITNVSHDLKTPLTSMVGYLELLKKEELSDSAKDYVEMLGKKQDNLKKMIEDLFELSKNASGSETIEITELDLNVLVKQILTDMEDSFAESGRRYNIDYCDSDTSFMANDIKMYRAIQNLIENSIKYSLEERKIYMSTFVEDGMICYEIKNITKEEIDVPVEELTERFKRGDKNRTTEGNGLGLSIVRSNVELFGGTLELGLDCNLFKAKVKLPKCRK